MAGPQPREFELKLISEEGGVLRLAASGRATHITLAESPEPIRQLLGEGVYGRKVVLGLAGLSFMDSSGIGWLLRCRRRFREQGGNLVIHSLPPSVAELIHLMRLQRILKIAGDETQALAMIQSEGG